MARLRFVELSCRSTLLNPVAKTYVERLREKFGSDLLLVPGARVVLESVEGKLLLGKRSDLEIWSFPGGTVEVGQSIQEAALREIEEEAGLGLKSFRPFGFASHPEYEVLTYPNGDRTHGFSLVVHSSDWEGELTGGDDENSAWRWFSIDSMPELREADRRTIAALEAWKRTGEFQLF
jgi:8-oxo-dGTP pyrophosphatase MutT (NUDIX family)